MMRMNCWNLLHLMTFYLRELTIEWEKRFLIVLINRSFRLIIEKVNRNSDLEDDKQSGLPEIVEAVDDEDRGTMIFSRGEVEEKDLEFV